MRFCQILFGAARVVRSSGSRLGSPKGRQAISLTQAAVSRIKELIQQKPGAKALKVILLEIKIFLIFIKDRCSTKRM